MTVPVLNFDDQQAKGCYQGADFLITLTYKDSANSVLDLTNYTANMEVRKNYESAIILDLNSDDTNAYITLDNTTNIEINIPKTATALLPAGKYIYDFKLTNAADSTQVLFKGIFVVFPSVTV